MFKLFVPVTILGIYGGSSIIDLYTVRLTMALAVVLTGFCLIWLLKQVCTNVLLSLTEEKTGMAWGLAVGVLVVFFSLALTVP
jgi:hypothetical protein